ncbi:Yip1 family protein [Novosphingobium sp.]|uniref:Yip1 family protein n=1 Tax=Novosphingobium sp. TaxID=1874826 RepID=UPI00273564BA|nr:Yip1 family protein [Novosphingobium sp.]MDP3905577.1 Yip1 family protein [Novosphingobium sp.]
MTDTIKSGFVERVKAMVMRPKDTWPAIAAESTTPGELLTGYAAPLAAIGPVAGFIGGQLFGTSMFGVTYKASFLGALTGAVLTFIISLIGVVILALLADWLAPRFGGTADRRSAFRLVIYGATASWLGGIFGLIPALAVLGVLLALYTLYVIYTGIGPMMKVPDDKRAGYALVTVIAALLLNITVGAVAATVTGALGFGRSAGDGELSGGLKIPGVGTVDAVKLEEASRQAEAAASGQQVAVKPAELQALLPAAIGSYQRTATQSAAMGGMGSTAEATYTAGDKSFTLKIVDMAGLGAIAGIGAAMGVEESKEDADGYERITTTGGQMQVEEWSKTDSRGKFGQMVVSRFMVEAEGDAASIDELKSAVAKISPDDLAGLVK